MFINEASGVYDVKKAEVLMEISRRSATRTANPFPTAQVSSGLGEGF